MLTIIKSLHIYSMMSKLTDDYLKKNGFAKSIHLINFANSNPKQKWVQFLHILNIIKF